MNTTQTDEVVLKQDVLGRVQTPKARREQLLDEFERSGLPGLNFDELVGIKYPTFATLAQKPTNEITLAPLVCIKARKLESPVDVNLPTTHVPELLFLSLF